MIKMTIDFYKELTELIHKYNLTLITTTKPKDLEIYKKKFSGNVFFITDGNINPNVLKLEK